MSTETHKTILQHINKDMNNVWVFGYGSLCWRPSFRYRMRHLCVLPGFVRRFYQASTDHRGTDEYPGRVCTVLPTGHADNKTRYTRNETITTSSSPQQHTPFEELVNEQIDTTVGVAYQLYPEDVESILAYLDEREQGGYAAVIQPVTLLIPTAAAATTLDHNSNNDNEPQQEEQQNLSLLDGTTIGELRQQHCITWFATDDNAFYTGHLEDGDIARRIQTAIGPSGPNIDYFNNLHQFMRSVNCVDAHLEALHNLLQQQQPQQNINNDRGDEMCITQNNVSNNTTIQCSQENDSSC